MADLHIEITAYVHFRGTGVNHRMNFIGEGPGPEPAYKVEEEAGF